MVEKRAGSDRPSQTGTARKLLFKFELNADADPSHHTRGIRISGSVIFQIYTHADFLKETFRWLVKLLQIAVSMQRLPQCRSHR